MIISAKLAEIVSEGQLKDATESETYVVRTDGSETARTLRMLSPGNAAGLPVIGELNGDSLLTATRVRVNRDQDSAPTNQVFYYSVDYAYPPDPTYSGGNVNPLDLPPDISWEGIEFTKTLMKDVQGVPFVNSVGDLYNPQPERVVLGAGVTITRNEESNPGFVCAQFSQTLNADDFFGVEFGNAKMGIISAQKVYENGYTYWRVTYPIMFNREGWKLKIIDNGFTFLNDDLQKEQFVDKNHNPLPIPRFLDGNAAALPEGFDPVFYPPDGFDVFESRDWAALNLPNPFE